MQQDDRRNYVWLTATFTKYVIFKLRRMAWMGRRVFWVLEKMINMKAGKSVRIRCLWRHKRK